MTKETNFVRQQQEEQGRLVDAGKFPKVILIDTVSLCNLKCSMCVHSRMKRKKGIMQWDLFTKIIDEIAYENKNIRVWMVFFGEALIIKKSKPSIFDMIRYAKKKGLKDVVLNSNANLMDSFVSKKLISSGLDSIYIGIDAVTTETYSKVRVGGNYKRVVSNVVKLVKLKNKLKSSKPSVYVQFVEMDINSGEKEKFIEFWRKYGVHIKIRPKISWAGRIEAPNLVLDNKERWPCYWAMQTMSITDRGKVVTCAVDLDAEYIAGDVSIDSLKKVWNENLKLLRHYHASHEFNKLPKNCRCCRDWQSARANYF